MISGLLWEKTAPRLGGSCEVGRVGVGKWFETCFHPCFYMRKVSEGKRVWPFPECVSLGYFATFLGGGNSNIFGIFTTIWGRFPI